MKRGERGKKERDRQRRMGNKEEWTVKRAGEKENKKGEEERGGGRQKRGKSEDRLEEM